MTDSEDRKDDQYDEQNSVNSIFNQDGSEKNSDLFNGSTEIRSTLLESNPTEHDSPTQISLVTKSKRADKERTFFDKAFKSTIGALTCLCLASMLQSMTTHGFLKVSITSLEKRFDLSSAESGNIVSSYEVGSLLAVLPVAYFGGRPSSSKPRYIGIGLIVMGMGSFTFLIPHFLSDNYMASDVINGSTQAKEYCIQRDLRPNETTSDTTYRVSKTSLTEYQYLFYVGNFLVGVGASPLIVLGVTFLDASAGKELSSLYIGIFQAFFLVGPAIGFLFGGMFLSLYVDFERVDEPPLHLTKEDERWIGAWWLGFVITCSLTWTLAICFFFIPGKLKDPENKAIEVEKVDIPSNPKSKSSRFSRISRISSTIERQIVRASYISKSGYGHIKEMPKNILRLLKNPTFMLMSIGGGFDGAVLGGVSAFTPKFIEYQYGFSSSTAALIAGMLIVPAGGLGNFFSGWIVKQRKLNRGQILKMCIFCNLLAIPASAALLFYCKNASFAGIDTSFNEPNSKFSFKSSTIDANDKKQMYSLFESDCNVNCTGCFDVGYMPICGSDEKIYFNPCYAGCKDRENIGQDAIYANCSCIPGNKKQATKDICQTACLNYYGMLTIFFPSVLFSFMSTMSSLIALLRFVEPIQRSLAIGFSTIFFRILGAIPGPIIYGKLIDMSCVISEGNCLFYDNFKMALHIVLVTVAFKVSSVSCYVAAFRTGKNSKVEDDDFSSGDSD